jgi:putative FmdB family regulatory protein
MPTYEYECTHCGHDFELFQGITEKPLKKCPKCNSEVKRLIGIGSGVIFKGSGFYATDYRKKTTAKKAKTEANVCPQSKEGCNACPYAK